MTSDRDIAAELYKVLEEMLFIAVHHTYSPSTVKANREKFINIVEIILLRINK